MGLFSSRPAPAALPPAYIPSSASSSKSSSSSSAAYSSHGSPILVPTSGSDRLSFNVDRYSRARADEVREEAKVSATRSQATRSMQNNVQRNRQTVSTVNRTQQQQRSPNIDPPNGCTNADGRWVLTEDFPGRKSFGYFRCHCGKSWVSAHAYKEDDGALWQKCQWCDQKVQPELMWENYYRNGQDRARNLDLTSGKPHDQARCQKCNQLGRGCWISTVY